MKEKNSREKLVREELARLHNEINFEKYKRTMHRTNPECWEKLKIKLKFDPYRERKSNER